MSTVYTVLDNRDKNELNMNLQNAKAELQGNIDSLTSKHDDDKNELQQQINTLVSEKATKNELTSHNTSNVAHNDIRILIQGLTDRINTLADSDDETLDQMSEIVAYIEDNRDLIESITTSKVNVSDIINNLTTNVANKPLSASMGVELKRLIDNIPNDTLDIVNEKIIAHNIAGDAHEDIRNDVLNVQGYASNAHKAANTAQQTANKAQSDATDALQRVSSLEVGSGKIDRIVSTSEGIIMCEDILQNSKPIEIIIYGETAKNDSALGIVDELNLCIGEISGSADTTIGINLSGHTMCSLPNGIRDEMYIDVNGDINLLVQCRYIQSYNNEDIEDNYMASQISDDGTPAVGSQVVYQLPSPYTVQLPSIDLPIFVAQTSYVWVETPSPISTFSIRYWLTNGELVSDLYASGATEELTDDEIIAIWDGASGDIVEATNADIEAIFYEE